LLNASSALTCSGWVTAAISLRGLFGEANAGGELHVAWTPGGVYPLKRH
jgi:hypothetical protein